MGTTSSADSFVFGRKMSGFAFFAFAPLFFAFELSFFSGQRRRCPAPAFEFFPHFVSFFAFESSFFFGQRRPRAAVTAFTFVADPLAFFASELASFARAFMFFASVPTFRALPLASRLDSVPPFHAAGCGSWSSVRAIPPAPVRIGLVVSRLWGLLVWARG